MGGKLIKDSVPVDFQTLSSVYDYVKNLLCDCDNPCSDYIFDFVPIGSYGKKRPHELYGDLDVAIQTNDEFDVDKFMVFLYHYGLNPMFIKPNNMISFGLDFIRHKEKNITIQVDLILTNNLNFTQWMYYTSPASESKYKGLYRNSLISMLTHKSIETDNENYTRYLLNYNTGLHIVEYEETKNYKLKEISREFMTKSPSEICKLLKIDDLYKRNKHFTYEELVEYLKDDYLVLQDHYHDLLKKKVDIPYVLAKALDEHY